MSSTDDQVRYGDLLQAAKVTMGALTKGSEMGKATQLIHRASEAFSPEEFHGYLQIILCNERHCQLDSLVTYEPVNHAEQAYQECEPGAYLQ